MFDVIINRKGTSSLKWDDQTKANGKENLLSFGIADMDFLVAPKILEALQHRVEHGIFGYTHCPQSLIEALLSWFATRHGWRINPDHLLEIPAIVPFLHIYTQFFTKQDESVIIQEPVYYPFRGALERNRRLVAVNQLRCDENYRWRMDFVDLEQTLEKTGAKTIILCSPHNPVGRVWQTDELTRLAGICRKRGMTVISDEIHADLIQTGFRHTPWLTLAQDSLPQSIALISATKSFSIPGLSTAWAVIPDTTLRKKIEEVLTMLNVGGTGGNPLSYAAAEAAWKDSAPWLDSLIAYVGKNCQTLKNFIAKNCPQVGISPLEGTYLAWLDFSFLGISDEKLWNRVVASGLFLHRGSTFGYGGAGYLRMNLACPVSRLNEGLKLLLKVVDG